LPCIYLGLSDDHEGFCCFDPSSERSLVSCHVTFDENNFPYTISTSSHTLYPNPPTNNSAAVGPFPQITITAAPSPRPLLPWERLFPCPLPRVLYRARLLCRDKHSCHQSHYGCFSCLF
jgi:hypothetical protein